MAWEVKNSFLRKYYRTLAQADSFRLYAYIRELCVCLGLTRLKRLAYIPVSHNRAKWLKQTRVTLHVQGEGEGGSNDTVLLEMFTGKYTSI